MSAPPSELGRRLYELLPAIYRERDNSDRNLEREERDRFNGDLGRYLLACGGLLDQVLQTLEQRLADVFPDNTEDGLSCQEWLLPYFAKLLDVHLVSPHADGRREEISRAVRWRQRKGTLACVEEIAEKLGGIEAEIQEGWKRLAVTPRVGLPLLPAKATGYATELETDPATGLFLHPGLGAGHPSLPAATVDFRCPSRAVKLAAGDEGNPAAQSTDFNGTTVRWRQASLHGAPCFPGTYEDVSRRTVDLRTPSWCNGHFHSRRVLLFVPPPAGLFPKEVKTILWSHRHEERFSHLFSETTEKIDSGGSEVKLTVYRNRTLDEKTFVPIRLREVIELDGSGTYRFEGLNIDNTLEIKGGGGLQLIGCAARKVIINTAATAQPAIEAVNTLIKRLQVGGLARLEYCTLLQPVRCAAIEASDCIFLDRILHPPPPPSAPASPLPPAAGCLRYSRIEPDQGAGGLLERHRCTTDPAVMFSTTFGEHGCGVLHPATPVSIAFGAEDGGEMGAYHRDRYSLKSAAVVDKLADYLPVGLEAVLIPDRRLLQEPPASG